MIKQFIEETYEDKERGIADIEILAQDIVKFNEFKQQTVKRKNDLKSVKEEFITSENNNIDIDEIVTDTQNLDNSQNEFLYDMPFEEYIEKITISERIYNGKYGRGSVFHKVLEFDFKNGYTLVKPHIEYCFDEKIREKALLEFSIPIVMKEDEIKELNEVLTQMIPVCKPYDNDRARSYMIAEYFGFTDVSINDVKYTIKSNNELLSKLKMILRYNTVDKAIAEAKYILMNSNI